MLVPFPQHTSGFPFRRFVFSHSCKVTAAFARIKVWLSVLRIAPSHTNFPARAIVLPMAPALLSFSFMVPAALAATVRP